MIREQYNKELESDRTNKNNLWKIVQKRGKNYCGKWKEVIKQVRSIAEVAEYKTWG